MKSRQSPAPLRVLLVEDDLVSANALSAIIRRRGFEVSVANTLAAGFAMLSENPAHVILDLMLPDGVGIDLLRHIRQSEAQTKVFVTTAVNDDTLLRAVYSLRPDAILPKPIDVNRLLQILRPSN